MAGVKVANGTSGSPTVARDRDSATDRAPLDLNGLDLSFPPVPAKPGRPELLVALAQAPEKEQKERKQTTERLADGTTITKGPGGELIRAENKKGSRELIRDDTGEIVKIIDRRATPNGKPVVMEWVALTDKTGKPTGTYYINSPGKYYSGEILQKNTAAGDIKVKAATAYDEFGRMLSFDPPQFERKIAAGTAVLKSDSISAIDYHADSTFITRIVREKQATRVYDTEHPDRLVAVVGERPVWGAATKDNKMQLLSRKFTRDDAGVVTGFVEQRMELRKDPKHPEAEAKMYNSGEPVIWKVPEGATKVEVKPNGDVTYLDDKEAAQVNAAALDIKLELVRQGSSNHWETKIGDKVWGDTYALELIGSDGTILEKSLSVSSDAKWHAYTRDRSDQTVETPDPSRFQVRRSFKLNADGSYEYKVGDSVRTSRVGGVYRNPGEEYHSETISEARSRVFEIADEVFGNPSLGGGPETKRSERFQRFAKLFETRMAVLGALQEDKGKIVGARDEMMRRTIATYDHLARLMETPERGDQIFAQRQRVNRAEEAMYHLHKTGSVDQGSNPTCQTAVIEIYGGEQHPDLYAGFLTDGSTTGKVNYNNRKIALPADAVVPGEAELRWTIDTAATSGNRSPTNKFMQVGLINAYRTDAGGRHPTYYRGNPWWGGFSIKNASLGWLGESIPVVGDTQVEDPKRRVKHIDLPADLKEKDLAKLDRVQNIRFVDRNEAERLLRIGKGPVAVTTMRGAHIQQLTGVYRLGADGNPEYQQSAMDNTWGGEAQGGDRVGTQEWFDKMKTWADMKIGDLDGFLY